MVHISLYFLITPSFGIQELADRTAELRARAAELEARLFG